MKLIIIQNNLIILYSKKNYYKRKYENLENNILNFILKFKVLFFKIRINCKNLKIYYFLFVLICYVELYIICILFN